MCAMIVQHICKCVLCLVQQYCQYGQTVCERIHLCCQPASSLHNCTTIAQLGVQYGHMGYYFITVAFMLVTVMLLSCCVPYYVVLLLDVMFVHVLHLSCLVCMYPNCFVAFPLYILVHGCPCFFIISNWTHKPHFWVLMQSSGQFWRWTIEVSN